MGFRAHYGYWDYLVINKEKNILNIHIDMCFGPLPKPPSSGGSFKGPQHMFI